MVMILNKEDSLKFVSIKRKGKMNLVPVGEGVFINIDFEIIYKNAALDIGRIKAYRSRYNYYINVNNADLSKYDRDFIKLFHDGIVSFYGEEWSIRYLKLKYGDFMGKPRNIVISFMSKDTSRDLLTGDDMKDFEKKNSMSLNWSMFFYDLYLLCKEKGLFKDNKLLITEDIKNDVLELLSNYDGYTEHMKTPESYYKFNEM